MSRVGVIGAGIMGKGVAQNLAQAKHQVVLIDISEEILKKAKKDIYDNIRFQAFYIKSSDMEDSENVISRITFSIDYQLLREVDFIIENVTERWQIKKDVYAQIDDICHKSCIFLINTSCIPITSIASLTKRPDKIIGTHFMNPVPMKTAVEVIRGYYTSEDTIRITKDFLASIGKESIVVEDCPGFVSNRISHLFMNEAAFLVMENIATPEQIDEIFKKCYGHKMGPLETADLIGLDTVVNSLEVLYENYKDPKFRCCPLLKKMVDAGLYGTKSGQGFYSY